MENITEPFLILVAISIAIIAIRYRNMHNNSRGIGLINVAKEISDASLTTVGEANNYVLKFCFDSIEYTFYITHLFHNRKDSISVSKTVLPPNGEIHNITITGSHVYLKLEYSDNENAKFISARICKKPHGGHGEVTEIIKID